MSELIRPHPNLDVEFDLSRLERVLSLSPQMKASWKETETRIGRFANYAQFAEVTVEKDLDPNIKRNLAERVASKIISRYIGTPDQAYITEILNRSKKRENSNNG